MTLEISRGYLRVRLIVVLFAFVAALTAGSAFMLYVLEQEKTKVKFGAALGTMADLTSDLIYSSTELGHSAHLFSMSMNSGGHGENAEKTAMKRLEEMQAAKNDFGIKLDRLRHLFHALEWSADGDITVSESQRLTAEETGEALFSPDPELSSVVDHIQGHKMPDAIRPMWSGGSETNLRRDMAELISVSNRLDLYQDLTGSTANRTFKQLGSHVETRVRPGITHTLDRLHADMIGSYFDLQKVTMIAGLSMVVFTLVIALSILFPMARRIAESHKELSEANAKFEAARDRAESSDKAKSEFLANMSHEIRTPMNGVLGMAELLAKTDLDTRQQTFTDVIVKSGNALLTIINDILDFSKIDAGQLELDPAPFKLSETVEDVSALMSTRIAEKDLELVVRIDPSLPTSVVGDVGRIRQVLTNLLGNAVKFTEVGHILINISAGISGRNNAGEEFTELTFSVEDTGVGIPPEKLDAVFQKFAQVDSSSTRRHEGTGLGLAIAARLVNLMGGEIQVESKVGQGTRFWFTVPMPSHHQMTPAKIPPVDVTDARIVIIDDNSVNREILMEQLSSWKFEGLPAASGQEGLEILAREHSAGSNVDCIILDFQMPEMNGEAIAKAIRENPTICNIPIILLTSVDQADFNRLVAEYGIAACLTKPARGSDLFDALIEALQHSRHVNSSPGQSAENPSAETAAASLQEEGPPNSEENPDLSTTSDAMSEPEVAEHTAVSAEQSGASQPSNKTDREASVSTVNGDESRASGDNNAEKGGSGASRLAAMAARMREERETTKKAADDAEQQMKKKVKPPLDEHLDILVAEDNKVNQMVFSQILDQTDLNYLIVGNGKRAVETHEKRNPRMILMDVSMPEMNGLEATRKIRESEGASPDKHTPIVGVTAHALKGDRERCINAGMDDYVSKPVSSEKLSAVIERWLVKNKAAAAS
ncbi:MAG: response regulator [Rhizobiaceae bacterium]